VTRHHSAADEEEAISPRTPPHSVEAEQSVLGGLLLDNRAWGLAGDVLTDSDFFDSRHGQIYAAIGRQIAAGHEADVITVFDQLQSLGKAEECGGLVYLNALAQSVPSAANMRRYAEIVRERAVLRKLVAASDEIATTAFNPKGLNLAAILERAQGVLASVVASSSHAPATRARTLDLRQLVQQKAPDQRWFRPHWLRAGATLLAGKGGEGKSSLVIHEAACGALGRSYITPEAEPYTSLVLNCEDDHDDCWRSVQRVCDHEGIDMGELAGRLHLVSRYGCDNALMAETQRSLVSTALLDELREQVNDLRIDVLWLDNVAHLFLGNHDDRTQVTQFINLLNGLVRGRPFGVVLVAHVSRAQGSEFSGSVAWENAARMRWYLGSKLPDQVAGDDEPTSSDASVRYLAKRKSNYSARDYVRMTMHNGLLVPDQVAQTHVGAQVSAMDEKRAEEICLAGFSSLYAMGIRTTDGKTSPDYLPSQMVSKGLAAGYGKSEIGKAMHRLMARHVFVRAPIGRHANRTVKFGLVLQERQS
jgi:hypothetical protein